MKLKRLRKIKMRIGDYVRTKRGLIGKIININTFREPCMKYGIEASYLDDIWFIGDDDIKLVKENPIELIEENDLVVVEYYSLRYKERVARLFEVDYIIEEFMTLKNAHCDFMLRNNEFNDKDKKLKPIIKSIITKEQIESIKYEVGDNK
jgi:predicted metal-binding transcription factor (methanogenesis marker protein 9)